MGREDVRSSKQVELMRLSNHLDFQTESHPGLFEARTHHPFEQPDSGEILDARESHTLQLSKKLRHKYERISAIYARQHRGFLDNWQHFKRHLSDNLIRISVSQEAC